ncbi:ABC transporter permease [Microbacterium rhizomatis]|uniref:ABC transporter permease n=1 Tax=Microbacterium rhizomatis TaxID=1631477 RepID=A0A5J5IXN4_9MICO|nr:ABC transporter permease [Microbacterium rhizomatis]KAA9106070.1 ABC transporter permease [Microbacterium rhizomatis]
MISFVLRRIATGVVLLFAVTTLTFFTIQLADIPVARNILGSSATPEQVAALNTQLGLDRGAFEQYWSWITAAVRGDFGVSYFTKEPVTAALENRLPVTLSIVLLALIFTVIFSLLLGVTAAARAGGTVDRVLQAVSTVSYVFPPIILGILLVLVFSITLHLVPATGYVPIGTSFIGWFGSVLLPAVTLMFASIASVAGQIRGSMIDELRRDYVRTLRSRGVSERAILLKYTLRNAASPALTTLSLQFIGMIGGALFIERIFALSGFGTYSFNSAVQGDLPAILGVVTFSVILVVIMNLLVDLVNGWLNPKARVQ